MHEWQARLPSQTSGPDVIYETLTSESLSVDTADHSSSTSTVRKSHDSCVGSTSSGSAKSSDSQSNSSNSLTAGQDSMSNSVSSSAQKTKNQRRSSNESFFMNFSSSTDSPTDLPSPTKSATSESMDFVSQYVFVNVGLEEPRQTAAPAGPATAWKGSSHQKIVAREIESALSRQFHGLGGRKIQRNKFTRTHMINDWYHDNSRTDSFAEREKFVELIGQEGVNGAEKYGDLSLNVLTFLPHEILPAFLESAEGKSFC